jgi:hypothetical protein
VKVLESKNKRARMLVSKVKSTPPLREETSSVNLLYLVSPGPRLHDVSWHLVAALPHLSAQTHMPTASETPL